MSTLVLDLNKSFVLNLDKAGVAQADIPTMEVRLAIDKSGSMSGLYRSGFVDSIVNRFLGVAMSFDDNGSVEVGFFNHNFHEAPEALPADVGRYMAKAGEDADGGTEFHGIIQAFETERGGNALTQAAGQVAQKTKGFLGKLFGGGSTPAPAAAPVVSGKGAGCAVAGMRAYVAIVTDGDNSDKREFEAELDRTSGEVFYQFICIGTGAPTSYLNRLAAKYPHVAVAEFRNPTSVTEDQFYGEIANPALVAWIKK